MRNDIPAQREDCQRLITLSATYRQLATDSRESLARSFLDLQGAFLERVGLHTCHRVELIGLTAPGAPLRKLPGVQLARGVDAAERVFLVAGGLDSAVVGEEQVLGQVRAAYEGALAAGDTGPILNELLRRAIAFGKRVRSEIPPRTDRSLADSAVRWAGQWLADRRQPTTALVIGTGEMGKLIAQSFAASGMTISVASRSVERARRFVGLLPNAERHRAMPLEEALGSAATHDVVAIAVRSASVPLEAMHLTYRHRVPLVIDLSAPRAVTPAAAEVLGDRLLDLDRLGATSSTPLSDSEDRRLRAAARDAARSFVDWWAKRSSAGAIAILHAHANEIRERHLERLRRRRQLTPEQFAAVETATSAMIGELLHAPTLRLQAEPAARDAVERVFGLES